MKYLVTILLFLFCTVITAATNPFTGPGTEKVEVSNDTTVFHISNLLTSPAVTVVDSASLYPAYDVYCSWNDNIHFNSNEALNFKDTVVVSFNPGSCGYVPPVINKVNSNFGYRRGRPHFGIDIDLETGDTVVAAFDGMVRVAKRDGGYGNLVVIRHSNGLETYYGHLSKIKVQPGQMVYAGDLIGLGGSTGHSTGSHLHFETRYKGMPLNPNDLISFSDNSLRGNSYTINRSSFSYLVAPRYTKTAKGKYVPKTTVATGIPKPKQAPIVAAANGANKYYVIRKGDTIYAIAKRYGTSVSSICKMNGLTTSTTLHVGTKIKCL